MKKFKFAAVLLAAAVTFSVALASCSGKDKDKDDEDDDRKIEKSEKLTETKLNSDVELTGDFEQALDYAEANAATFFPEFHQVMLPVKGMLENGTEPSEAEGAALEKFAEANQKYFEAIGVLLAHSEQADQLTPEQQQRLDAFGEKYSEGLEEVGLLLGIGMAAGNEDMMQQ